MEGVLRSRVLKLMQDYYKATIKDPVTCAKLTPSYEMGCKRITPSNHYLQSFNKENVHLVTEKIVNFMEDGIQTEDGKLHEFDAIIYATGFSVMENTVSVYGQNGLKSTENNSQVNGSHVEGTHGNDDGQNEGKQNSHISLKEEWADRPNAYKGITYPGYPNLFFLLGPGTGLGHNSVVYMIECQVSYTVEAIKEMVLKDIKSLAVKKEVNERYQTWVQEVMKNKVFNSTSCLSWYKNKAGINYTLWPSHLTHYWWATRSIDLDDYHCKW